MIIEMHSIQNIAPSNLNRDDTGSPKDCTFGGVRRGRISSQALKRAARRAFLSYGLTPEEVGVRTRRVVEAVVDRLALVHGRDREAATKVAANALANFGLTGGEYLLFVSRQGIEALADRCNDLFDELSKDKPTKGAIKELSADILLDASGQVDVALFGRMVADLPNANVDAASQVAHAISTHEVRPEFDYFTAVDDLQEESPERETGAGHIDTLEFNSACYYRYAAVDSDQLLENLNGDEELSRRGLTAFLMAMVHELPRGKQNSMAAHNPPSLVMTTVRPRGQWNLANAFEEPVRRRNGGLVQESSRRLLEYYQWLSEVYDSNRPTQAHLVAVDPDITVPAGVVRHGNVSQLVSATVDAALGTLT